MKRLVSLFFFLLAVRAAPAADFLVTRATDGTFEEGELRVVLQHVCDEPGEDVIRFAPTRLSEIRIPLESPLVIPADCQGGVTLIGSDEVDTLLDGSALAGGGRTAGDNCTFHIYSDRHRLRNLSFVGNENGAGVCLFGRSNRLEGSRLGVGLSESAEPNKFGVVISDIFAKQYPGMDGGENQVIGNRIRANRSHGVYLEADQAVLSANEIAQNGGAGIVIAGASTGTLVGGSSFAEEANRIQNNRGGGVMVLRRSGEEISEGHTVTHNTLSQNEGTGANLDLNNDGPTPNDFWDGDLGPNRLLNTVHHFQAFPLAGENRYWGWGLDPHGTRVELYGVAPGDLDNRRTHGGGEVWLADADILERGFEAAPEILSTGDWTTLLTFDGSGNTSEFSLNLPVDADDDLDGIIDRFERETKTSSLPGEADSDEDGLPDPIEDKNRNGVWDREEGETSAALADSDGDGLNDWAETHGDGIFHPGVDTDPLNPDTDGDGVLDGQEDANGDGIWDGYLGESNPLLIDSDADGFNDRLDTCPAIFNPGQEPWYCE